jgi:hypothetical protein
MKWQQVQENWSSFYEAILDKWPDADEADLDETEGEQRAFIAYIAELTGQEMGDARDEIRDWLANELPADLILESDLETEDEDAEDDYGDDDEE